MRTAWLLAAFGPALVSVALAADEAGFVPLFDGKTLDGWVTKEVQGRGYIPQDGILLCPPDGGGNIFTTKEYANFVLRLEYRMEEDTNNGVGIRSPITDRVSTLGMEIQIIDIGPKYKADRLRPEQLHGSVYDLIPARQGFLRKLGEWNEQEIRMDGRHIAITVNGAIVLDTDLGIVREPEVLKKRPGVKNMSGHIGLLGHGSKIEYRNIRIKELP
ncbi:MAG TPA: DUF1080 domain-containing protein [Bryobacteraceae bacterium]|nr:DUF1080 domain-containing protein [Bryobacteraceae bacterium]